MATIFISHSSRNDALATMLAGWLTRNGFNDHFIDHDSIRTGDRWTEELRRAKGACRVVLCLVTPQWLASDECYGEYIAGWYVGRRMMPLLAIKGAKLDEKQQKRLSRVLIEDQGADIGPAGAPKTLDLDGHPEIAEPLKAGLRAAGALEELGLDPYAFEIDRHEQPEPFPGLASFADTDADAAIFFGRSEEIARCLEDLREIRATGDKRAYVILGASGSGKSSLMKAGVLPRLRRERSWLVLRVLRPGADPLLNLADAIVRTAAAVRVPAAAGVVHDELRAAWSQRADPTGLRQKLEAVLAPIKAAAGREGATTLISIDQGEELVRAQGESADAFSAYLRAALSEVLEGEPAPFAVTLTFRSDSFREFETSPNFEGLETRVQNIRALPVHRFGASIEQPALRYGVQIEAQLMNALMDDAEGQDALPLLAFTLQRLWRRFATTGCLRESHYHAMGKLSGLIEDAAERALRGMDPLSQEDAPNRRLLEEEDRSAARVFIPSLTDLNERGAPIRRVADLATFDETAQALLDHLANWRLVVKSKTTVEVAHEAIFREWPRFQTWLAHQKDRLETLRDLASAAALWALRGRNAEDLIHRGKRLAKSKALTKIADYKALIDQSEEMVAYLDACTRAQFRHRMLIGGGAVAVAAIVLLVASIPAIVRQMELAKMAREHRAAVASAQSYKPSAPILADGAAASSLAPKAVFRDCQNCPEMLVIPGGAFDMGTLIGPSVPKDSGQGLDESPQHPVTVRKFALGRYDVTFDDWDACVADGGCPSLPTPDDYAAGRGRRPVIAVSWQDAQVYAKWLSDRTKQAYRLATEAEWEYSARAGTTMKYYTGSTIDHMQADFGDFIGSVEPVGAYPPNQFGLYDMAGNAWQWVEDCYVPTYKGAPADGSAWLAGDCLHRILRGGSWFNDAPQLRSAQRNTALLSDRPAHAGFRVARSIVP